MGTGGMVGVYPTVKFDLSPHRKMFLLLYDGGTDIKIRKAVKKHPTFKKFASKFTKKEKNPKNVLPPPFPDSKFFFTRHHNAYTYM